MHFTRFRVPFANAEFLTKHSVMNQSLCARNRLDAFCHLAVGSSKNTVLLGSYDTMYRPLSVTTINEVHYVMKENVVTLQREWSGGCVALS